MGLVVTMNCPTLPTAVPLLLVTVTSLALNPMGTSSKVKVRLAVCPSFNVVVSQVMTSAGAALSTQAAKLFDTELVEVTLFELSVMSAVSCAETV